MRLLTTLALLGALALTGCKCPTPTPVIQTVTVKVPVMEPYPEPPVTQRPNLLVYQLTADDATDTDKIVKYYKATIKQLQGYSMQLETIIDGYRHPVDPTLPAK